MDTRAVDTRAVDTVADISTKQLYPVHTKLDAYYYLWFCEP